MKILTKIFFVLIILVAGVGVVGIYFLSAGPKDLGIKYSEADRSAARGKSQVEYGVLSPDTLVEKSLQTEGKREVKFEFSSAEATALMNNRPWKYWPYKDVQVKFNADGSAEVSGRLVKSRVPGYAVSIGIPEKAIEVAMKFLPNDPAFYLKMKAELTNNEVTIFKPEVFEIGRIPLPVERFLSLAKPLAGPAYAMDTSELLGELAKVENKRALIVGYINQRLGRHPGFFATSAKIVENSLMFEGTLPEKELVVTN